MTLSGEVWVLWAVFTWANGNEWQPLQVYPTSYQCDAARLDLDSKTPAYVRGVCRLLEETNDVDTTGPSDLQ